jgi:hypothetical protein
MPWNACARFAASCDLTHVRQREAVPSCPLMRYLTFVLLAAAAANTFAAETRPPAYSAEMIATGGGETIRTHVWSDGKTLKSESADGKTGRYVDYDKKLSWVYGPGFPCVQVPTEPEGYTVTSREEVLGSETIDRHPVKKVKITSTIVHEKKTTTSVVTEWRATDLHDLALRRSASDGSYESHLEHVVLGVPDAKLLTFPNPPCKYDATADTTHNAAQAAGGFRAVSFFDASCKKLVPLPLMLSIPSDYAIRGYGTTTNCFWGANDDLDRVITREGPDFEHIRRGVFWARVSNTGYDPVRKVRQRAGDGGPMGGGDEGARDSKRRRHVEENRIDSERPRHREHERTARLYALSRRARRRLAGHPHQLSPARKRRRIRRRRLAALPRFDRGK